MKKNIWFTSDHHFHHKNIIKYCNRPFEDVREMNAVMIERWNEVVKPHDTVYHLGDFTFSGRRQFTKIIKQLKGRINILQGNHDKGWWRRVNEAHFNKLPALHEFSFSLPDNPLEWNSIVLSHYPMRAWNKSHHGSIHLFGHSHGNMPDYGKSFDVGVDTNNFYPYSLEEVLERVHDSNETKHHNA